MTSTLVELHWSTGIPRSSHELPAMSRSSVNQKQIAVIAVSVCGTVLFMCCILPGFVAILGSKSPQATQKALAEADAQWNAGDKTGALAKYGTLLDSTQHVNNLSADDRARVYGRVIDSKFEGGQAELGKKLVEAASKSKVMPVVSHPAARQAVEARAAEVKKEQERVAAAEAGKKEQERKANLSPTERLKRADWDELVGAQILYNEFDGNEVAASEKYTGKTIMVDGTVEKVEKGSSLGADIIYLRGRLGHAVRCSLAGGRPDELRQLRSGSWVRVQGRCDARHSRA